MLLRISNPYVESYKHMYETMRANEQGDNAPTVLRFRSGDTPDPRRYNEPSGRDVAAIFTGDRPPSRREISVYDRSSTGTGDTHDVSYLNEHVDPMTYPLLFPSGERGWCPELQVAGLRKSRRTLRTNSERATSMLRNHGTIRRVPHAPCRRPIVSTICRQCLLQA